MRSHKDMGRNSFTANTAAKASFSIMEYLVLLIDGSNSKLLAHSHSELDLELPL